MLSEAEHDFIAEVQGRLSNNQSYWIGGSTRTTGDIDYLHYLPYHIGPGQYIIQLCYFNRNLI